jgi:hypothetical protein
MQRAHSYIWLQPLNVAYSKHAREEMLKDAIALKMIVEYSATRRYGYRKKLKDIVVLTDLIKRVWAIHGTIFAVFCRKKEKKCRSKSIEPAVA